ncbi:MAG: peptide chain release factor N(5)-glutamine methyltransferase [Deltaproteobacteria bacterium]|nr:peptide chain release factor N(5)-glutamine methyltransferase [Deltaproteobacteria bacterium]
MSVPISHILTQAIASLTIHGIPNPRLDAEVLLAHALGLTRTGLYTRLQDDVSATEDARFQQLLQRRQQREPLQYITGVQEFWSLEFQVTPDVLIPRPETELIVETVLRSLAQSQVVTQVVSREQEIQNSKFKIQNSRLENSALAPLFRNPQSAFHILDVGTGSGCIAIALAKELLEAVVWATDISCAALAVAQKNAQRHGVAERMHFLHGDLFAPLQNQQLTFDFIISNPPYIVHNDIPMLQPEVANWEPRSALDGGTDGRDFYRRLLSESSTYLRPGGHLVMEIGHGQGADVLQLARQQRHFSASSCLLDYEGRERVVWVQMQPRKFPPT